jgi:hypothetical protein
MFKFLIEGKTIKELKANVDEFFKEFEALQPSVKVNPSQDISAHFAAKLPDLPKVEAPEPARSIPSPGHVPSAPSPAITPVTAPVNDYGVDSRGLPWDERIHSVTQAKVKDGSWRYKRGVEENTIKTVEAELATKARETQGQTVVASPQIPVVSNVPPIPSNPSVPAAPSMNHLNVVPPIPAAPIAPPLPPPPPAVPSAHSLKTFKDTLVPTLAKLVKDGKLTPEYIKQLCDHYKVEMLFQVNDDQFSEVFDGFVQYGLIVKAE